MKSRVQIDGKMCKGMKGKLGKKREKGEEVKQRLCFQGQTDGYRGPRWKLGLISENCLRQGLR